MEVLSDILRSMRVKGSVYFCDQLEAPWEMDFNAPESAGFHLVRRGECWIDSGDIQERLGPGDLVFITAGRDHSLASHPAGSEPPPVGSQTLLLCGYCDFADDTVTPLMGVFPSLTIVREEEFLKHPWLRSTLDQLSAEYLSQQPGSELVVNKLTEVVLVELIRISFGHEKKSPFVRALTDKRISRALERLHDEPERAWTLEILAHEIGMSRAAFAKRFKSLVEMPMFEYLTALRMQRARELLANPRLPLHDVAARVGYESELAFTRSFKRQAGVTPTRYRRSLEGR